MFTLDYEIIIRDLQDFRVGLFRLYLDKMFLFNYIIAIRQSLVFNLIHALIPIRTLVSFLKDCKCIYYSIHILKKNQSKIYVCSGHRNIAVLYFQ